MVKKAFGFYRLPMYLMVRPFDGFYAMKYMNQGKMRIAFLNFFLLSASISFTAQYASLVVNQAHPQSVHSLWDLVTLGFVVVLFCASNWAVTCLTDGEGKFKEIFMTVCYAMTPMVISMIPAALFSNLLSAEEAAFYTIIQTVAMAWFVFLLFIGLVVVHNYTASKAVITIILTFVSLLVIVFLITLLLTMWQQLAMFIQSLYIELAFRG